MKLVGQLDVIRRAQRPSTEVLEMEPRQPGTRRLGDPQFVAPNIHGIVLGDRRVVRQRPPYILQFAARGFSQGVEVDFRECAGNLAVVCMRV